MKRFHIKMKAVSLLFVVLLALSGLFVTPNKAKATNYVGLLNASDTAQADFPVNLDFNMQYQTDAYIEIDVPARVDMTVNIYASGSTDPIYTGTATETSVWEYDSEENVYYFPITWGQMISSQIIPGSYRISVTFGAETRYTIGGIQIKPPIAISNKTLILTKGFSQKLSTTNGVGTVKWTSDKKNTATVDSNGKVTAKNIGKATITATSEDGSKATCKVTVKANAYTNAKMTFADCTKPSPYINCTKVSYDKKGNLIIKARILNNCGYQIVKIKSLQLNVKNASGKIIGTSVTKNKKISIKNRQIKGITFTIKKSKLKIKKMQDLRNASISIPKKWKCSTIVPIF